MVQQMFIKPYPMRRPINSGLTLQQAQALSGGNLFNGVGDLFGKIAGPLSPFIPGLSLLSSVKGLMGSGRRRATPKRKSTKRKTKK